MSQEIPFLNRFEKQCISFEEDQEGFRYPLVNKAQCIDCGLCEKVCPYLNQKKPHSPISLYAAINPDEDVRLSSSSGGVFSIIAKSVIKSGGVVFGARFDENWEVKHCFTETLDGIKFFYGSKYVQSRIGDTYKQAQEYLKAGKKVLFTGTSCQIAGLHYFLRKEYSNLITVDVICHGTPSPLIWRQYIDEVVKGADQAIHSDDFRNYSWSNYNFRMRYDNHSGIASLSSRHQDNDYMYAFLQNIILRPSCHNCPAKQGKSMSDITLADFWGVQNVASEINDDKGVSLIIINTGKGRDLYQSISLKGKEMDEEVALKGNLCFYNSVLPHNKRDFFFQSISEGKNFHDLIHEIKVNTKPNETPSSFIRIRRFVSKIVHKFIKRGELVKNSQFVNSYPPRESNTVTRAAINDISFRNKAYGWKNYQMVIELKVKN